MQTFFHYLAGAACALLLATQSCRAQAQSSQFNYSPAGQFQGFSQIVPQVATDIWPHAVPVSPVPGRLRAVAMDATLQAGYDATVTVWCAWGTAAQNPAVIGSNGFPLNAGFDDNGPGVNQSALNCIQAAGSAHYVRFETY